MIRIGFPRGLLYYDYYPFWEAFLTSLNLEVIPSIRTNKEILNLGIETCVDEACLPVKIYHGHVAYLKDKVDYIFVPKYYSLSKREYGCPKHLGIAYMIENSIASIPKLVSPKIDNNHPFGMRRAAFEAGSFFTKDGSLLYKAYKTGVEAQKNHIEWLKNEIIKDDSYTGENRQKILVLGHGYNIYDDFVNMNIIAKIAKQGYEVVLPDQISQENIRRYSDQLKKRMFWSNGRRVVGAAYNLIEENKIDGIVYISAFGCGLDSVLIYLVETKANDANIPIIIMTYDEQTGEAGFNTRIEAFIDMVKWRNNLENNVSSFR